MDISDFRREYMSLGLNRDDLLDDPFQQFEHWFKQVNEAGLADANALSLTTFGEQDGPTIRTVLLKLFDEKGFVFFTNYGSLKARQIRLDARAGMLFPWLALNRQVIIRGRCEKISSAESFRYFSSRPRGSQLGAWCSDQSEIIESRAFLEQKFAEIKEKFKSGRIPLPSIWGGYRLVPEILEFWQGRENRLHDRFQYDLQADGGWKIARLAP
jgi:pyridoxamine 5'-phosphate oxidase